MDVHFFSTRNNWQCLLIIGSGLLSLAALPYHWQRPRMKGTLNSFCDALGCPQGS